VAVVGALGDAGPNAGTANRLGVREMPGSGTAQELRAWAGIDAASIAARAREAVGPR